MNDIESILDDAVMLWVRGENEVALTKSALVLAEEPDNFEALELQSHAAEELENLKVAVRSARRMIKLRPDAPEGHCALANALVFVAGDLKNGEASAMRALIASCR